MESQIPRVAKIILKKDGERLTYHTSWLQNLLESYSNKECGTGMITDVVTNEIEYRAQK